MAVVGLEFFAESFSQHRDKYVLIGGSACDINFEELGLDFRATKDLDIVLVVEVQALDVDFARKLWEFIEAAGYETKQKANGKPALYRFAKPKDPEYPFMLEFFSRHLESLSLEGESHLSPIPAEDGQPSMSAILLNDDYYRMVLEHRRDVEGVCIVSAECLIPLKARAHLDLRQRRLDGDTTIKKRDIKKHKNDVFRLVQLLPQEAAIEIPTAIRDDLRGFIQVVQADPPDLRSLGVQSITFEQAIEHITGAYGLGQAG